MSGMAYLLRNSGYVCVRLLPVCFGYLFQPRTAGQKPPVFPQASREIRRPISGVLPGMILMHTAGLSDPQSVRNT